MAEVGMSPTGTRVSLLGLLTDNGVLENIGRVMDEYRGTMPVVLSACRALEALTLESECVPLCLLDVVEARATVHSELE